jgi:sialidase-1
VESLKICGGYLRAVSAATLPTTQNHFEIERMRLMHRASRTGICVGLLLVTTAWTSLHAEQADSVIPLDAKIRATCLEVLRGALRGEEFWPAMHAAEALTLAGQGEEVRKALSPLLKTEQDSQRRCGLAREIVRGGDRAPLTVLWQILADEQSNGRVHAAESLYKLAEVGDGKLLRAAFAQTENGRLRLMAAAGLARTGNPLALAALRNELSSDDREVRKLAAWALGLLGDSQDIAAIRKAQQAEPEPLANSFFINALACLGDKDARAALGRNLSSEEAGIRTYAADFASYARCKEFRPRLIEMLDDPNVDVRARSAQALIALSLPAATLGLPVAVASEDIQLDVYPASAKCPRYSEGSIIALHDNSLLYATTEFVGGGADHATATIVCRTSQDGGRTWGEQRTLQENIGKQNVMSVTLRRLPPGGDTAKFGMFFLVKNSQTDLDLVLRISADDGKTFGEPILITPQEGYHVMNNDRVCILSSGRIVCPVATTPDVFKKGGGHFVCVCHLSDDGGRTWRQSTGQVDQPKRGAMEPEVVELADGRLLMIVRTQLGYIATSVSEDGGDHWSDPARLPVEAPESPATIRTIPATGDLLLIWNRTYRPGMAHGGKRTPLTAAISSDCGQSWRNVRQLETAADQEFAYTSVLFYKDRALLSYYVQDAATKRISSRFRSLPARWFYEKP